MNTDKTYHVHITAKENPMTLNLREIWAYRDLIVLFTKRSFNLIYKQTILGPAWVVLTPLMTSVVYTVVFGEMAGLSTAGVPKLLFYLSSQALWSFFSACLNRNAQTFISNAHVFGKVYFPRLAVPISNLLFSCIQFLVQLTMVSVLLVPYCLQGTIRLRPTMLPLLILPPMTAPMELFRLALLGTGTVHVVSVLSTLVFSGILIPLSILVFNRVEKNFIDTV